MFVPYFLTLPAQLANWKINYLRGSGMGSSGELHSCVFSPHRVPGSIWHTEWCCGERKDRQQEHSPCKSWAKRTMYSQTSLGNHDRVKQVIPSQNWARTGAHCAYRCREASKAASALFSWLSCFSFHGPRVCWSCVSNTRGEAGGAHDTRLTSVSIFHVLPQKV